MVYLSQRERERESNVCECLMESELSLGEGRINSFLESLLLVMCPRVCVYLADCLCMLGSPSLSERDRESEGRDVEVKEEKEKVLA